MMEDKVLIPYDTGYTYRGDSQERDQGRDNEFRELVKISAIK